MDEVFFPKNSSKMVFSSVLLDFFNENKINVNDTKFDLNLLRETYKSDPKKFFRLKTELEFKGFNFSLRKNNIFLTSIDYSNYRYLYTNETEMLSPFELQKLGLWKTMAEMNIYSKQFLNYLPLERVEQFAKYKNNLEQLLEQIGFKIVEHKETNNLETSIENLDEYILHSIIPQSGIFNEDVFEEKTLNGLEGKEIVTSNNYRGTDNYEDVFSFKPLLAFLSNYRKVSTELHDFLFRNNILTINDLLMLDEIKYNSLLSKYGNTNDYSITILFKELKLLKTSLDKLIDENDLEKEKINDFLIDYQRTLQLSAKTSFINSNYIYISKSVISGPSVITFENIGLYEEELKVLKEASLWNIYDIFKVDFNTKLGVFRTNKYELSTYYFDFYELINKIIYSLNNESYLNIEALDKNHYAIRELLSIDTYLNKLKLRSNENYNVLDIMIERDKGKTLEEIAAPLNITRERVRQIQARFLKENKTIIEKYVLSKLEPFNYLPIFILKNYPGIMVTINSNNDLFIDDKIGVAFKKKLLEKINFELNLCSDSNDFYRISNEIFSKTGFDLRYITNISESKYLVFPKKSLREIGAEYLYTKGEKGYSTNDDIDEIINFFTNYERKIENQRNIYTYITDNDDAILVDLGKYIHKAYINKNHIKAMIVVIDKIKFDHYGKSTKEIFEKNKSYLVNNGINNYYYLYGLTKSFYDKKPLVFSGRGMRIGLEGITEIDENIIATFLKQNNNIAKDTTIKEKLNVTNISIQQAKDVYRLDSKTIVYKDFFSITGSEKTVLLKVIDDYINKQGYCHAKNIISELYFNNEINGFFRRNKLGKNPSRLGYYLRYYFSDLYNVSAITNSVSPKGVELNSASDLLELHFNNKPFTNEELNEVFDFIGINNKNYRKKIISESIIKIDSNSFLMKKFFNVDLSYINEIIAVVDKYFSNEKIIFAKEVVRKLKNHNIGEALWENEELLTTYISMANSSWKKVNINLISPAFTNRDVMLYNNKAGKKTVNIDDVIIEFIFEKNNGYVTYDQINETLFNYEIITSKISEKMLSEIFSKYDIGGIIKVAKNEF